MNTTDRRTTGGAADALTAQLTLVEEAFTEAMISNDVSRISACIADDWVLVTPEVGVVSRERILRVIETVNFVTTRCRRTSAASMPTGTSTW